MATPTTPSAVYGEWIPKFTNTQAFIDQEISAAEGADLLIGALYNHRVGMYGLPGRVKQAERENMVLDWRERWHPLLLQILSRRLPVSADVSDLAQEVYLRLLRVEKLDLVQDPRAYLCRVAINIASEWRLRSARLPTTPSEDLPDNALIAEDDLEQWLDKQQNRNAVEAAVRELPAHHRTALVLHVTKDLTYPQIADHMGVTGRQVKRYLAKAYDRLRCALIAAET